MGVTAVPPRQLLWVVKKYLKMPPRSALQLLGALGFAAGVVWLGAGLVGSFGGDSEEAQGETSQFGLSANQDAWVPGQPPLTDDPFYLELLASATATGDRRWAARAKLLRLIEERAERARKAAERRAREEAARRRREQLRALARLRAARLKALRRARAKYREALREAAEAKRRRERELAEQRRKLREQRRALERKRRIQPGEECQFESVQNRYDCEEGRL